MHIAKTIFIACPPERLWPHLTDPALIGRWLDELVEDIPDDPARTTGVGVRSTMRLREGGKIQAYQSVMTAWDEPRRVALRLTGGSFAPGMAMDVEYRISAQPGGSRLDYDVRVPLKGVMFTLLAPVMWLVSQANARKSLRKLSEAASRAPA